MGSRSDTIAAVATPFGQGAIAILRLSGPESRAVLGKVWRGPTLAEPRRAQLGEIVDGNGTVIDQALALFFQSPASYTGEEVVEISCHGGVLVTRRVLEVLLAAGARAAKPGEFTQRAFLNGKMDLTQAEAVMDLISAQTELARRSAREQLAGRLGGTVQALRAETLGVLAHVEAWIDFPEEDIDPDTGAALLARIHAVQAEVAGLLATADQGRVLREGVRTVIAGPPNVGKSSLLNRLLGFDRAIVSETAGTTRDTIEEVISLRGIPLRLVDTAGLRHGPDSLEQQGVARSNAAIAQADLVLEVADVTRPRDPRPSLETACPRLLILNKCDLAAHPTWADREGIRISCATGGGIDSLAEAIEGSLTRGSAPWTADPVTINARHHSCLLVAHEALAAAHSLLATHQPPELAAEELRAALEAIGDVVGRVDNEDLLGVIFGRFCIGK